MSWILYHVRKMLRNTLNFEQIRRCVRHTPGFFVHYLIKIKYKKTR